MEAALAFVDVAGRFGEAIGEEHERRARDDIDRDRLQARAAPQAEHHPGRTELLDAAVRVTQDRARVTGRGERKLMRTRVEDAGERGCVRLVRLGSHGAIRGVEHRVRFGQQRRDRAHGLA